MSYNQMKLTSYCFSILTRNSRKITFVIDSIKFRGNLLWSSIPDLVRRAPLAAIFKRNMENLNGEEGNCKVC